ncbi:GNAT family N-acetyltransferase [Pseudomonas fontis]|uniref:GNAT family N-acetyltransferase n=1 Tax=Pseudomonas fontis TaxID=2942633 RepID=A0ABT5NMG1_9PSED|nr:GNAT family N-acetyltransferase [Pseudomonas fontis]MDD0976610.1 GNAT family N-acetyltransferase [Pseudomonas fontis]MDD0988958.1 GNAT family N-acetyltransferase [Pseudomonas fontis]
MQAAPLVRPAGPRDAEQITALVMQAYASYIPRIGKQPGPMLEDYSDLIANAEVFVIDRDADILGVLVLNRDNQVLHLDNIAVLPRCKGQGLGKALMAFSEDFARRNGCNSIQLYTHQRMTENVELYKKLGYVETHRATENGFARVFLRKSLQM